MQVSKMNSFRHTNQANLGFYPTDLSVVELEMNLIDFSELTNKNVLINMCDLSGGLGDQLDYMHRYLDKMGIDNKCYYNELNYDRYMECLNRYPYMAHINGDANYLKIGVKRNNQCDKKVFGIVRNNPPYGFDTIGKVNVRLEKKFLEINSNYDFAGAIQFYEIPIGQLDKDLLNFISYRYEMKAFKFPKAEFSKFKQVCLILKKKKTPKRNKKEVDQILEDVKNDTMLGLDEVTTPVFSLTYNDVKFRRDIYYFRENKQNTDTLKSGAEQVWQDIVKYQSKKNRHYNFVKDKPIIELLQGHISSLLASGRYNGIMGDLLITGGSNKVIKEVVDYDEEGKEIITETEILQPFFELTNKSGEIMYKDF